VDPIHCIADEAQKHKLAAGSKPLRPIRTRLRTARATRFRPAHTPAPQTSLSA
jgi:hypothetical protein